MAHSEYDVIKKIRESKDPEQALRIVMEITYSYLAQLEYSQEESLSVPGGISA
jgi:hypothetical protein